MTETDDYFVEAAAITAASVAKYPFVFWVKFWEAMWSIPR